jgi:hypothetical protein
MKFMMVINFICIIITYTYSYLEQQYFSCQNTLLSSRNFSVLSQTHQILNLRKQNVDVTLNILLDSLITLTTNLRGRDNILV